MTALLPRPGRHSMLRRLLITHAICLAFAAVLTLTGSDFRLAWLYSALIGTLCSLLIDGGRHVAARLLLQRPGPHPTELREGWPGWGWMAPIILIGGLAGFFAGSLLGDLLSGHLSDTPLNGTWRASGGIVVISIVIAVGATWYFYSSSRIASIEAEVAQVGRLAAETQLKLLESQLEPHMLFNTLANLRALIGVDPVRAQAMLDRLIDFLRATLNASRATMHPLSAEFARIGDYLALMQIRMGDRLRVEFELPPALAGLPVPPLLLQPLVENAIKHGLEPLRAGGLIRISASSEGETLTLRVLDTGRGPSAPRVPGDPPGGFGLTQVRERLATLYGSESAFDLGPGPDATGTLAVVHLPLTLPTGLSQPSTQP